MAPKFKRSALASELTTTIELKDGSEVDVVVEYSYEPGSPGKTYGPPEDCYPAEGESAEILCVTLDEKDQPFRVLKEEELADGVMEMLTERACEDAREADEANYESAMEDRADAQREREWDP